MALITFGVGISNIRGSIGGTSFGACKSGATMFLKPRQLRRKTLSQTNYLSTFHYLAGYWQNTMTAATKQSYNDVAQMMIFKNRLGNTSTISGFNLFMKKNIYRLLTAQTIQTSVANYPGFATTLIPNTNLMTISASTGRFTPTTGAFTGFTETITSARILVFATPMKNSNLRVDTRFIKFLGYFSGAGGAGGFNPTYLTLPNQIRAGKYICLKIIHLDSESRFSNESFFNKTITT